MRKPDFCIYAKTKGADQLRDDRTADQRICFLSIYSTIPVLPNTKFKASGHLLWLYSSVCVRPGRKLRIQFFRATTNRRYRIGPNIV